MQKNYSTKKGIGAGAVTSAFVKKSEKEYDFESLNDMMDKKDLKQ